MKITTAASIKGRIKLPGDKSISHRAGLFAALAEGTTKIENFGSSVDCASTLDCLRRLGVEIERDGANVSVRGIGKHGFKKSAEPLDCGNSGTTVRLISGILAGQPFETVLTGDESLSKRPMKRIIAPLGEMGARIESNDFRLPLKIVGRNPLRAIQYAPDIASAQLKSAVLLAGLFADGTTEFLEKTPTRDHTERMLRWFGVNIGQVETVDGARLSISGTETLKAKDFRVPSDVSSAAFFLVATACRPDSELIIENVGLNPTRTAVIEVLQNFGAEIEITEQSETCNEPVGTLRVRGKASFDSPARSNIIRGAVIANLIDELPILAVFGTQIEGGIEVRDARELRIKESDRISAVVENLRRMNARVEEFEDGFRVSKSNLQGARIDSFGDHRIAMAFAVAGLFAEGESVIDGAEHAAVSFPEFFETLRSVAK